MAPYSFRLHDIGEGVAEAEIVTWHVKPGDRIAEDQPMVDVMTDKATVELSSPVEGVVLRCLGEIGQRMPVGSSLIEIELDREAPEPPRIAAPTPAPAAPAAEVRAPAPEACLAAPATRKRAQELGVALALVPPTGPEGRITAADLEDYLARQNGHQGDGVTETKLVGLRRKIAEKMQQAARRIPHFSYVEECDASALEALRAALNADRGDRPKLTLLPFLMRALVQSLPRFPAINARYDDDAEILRSYRAIHVGIATQTEAGLMVPVVRNVETRDLWDCARELARVTPAARGGSATREILAGSTITLTSLGALGGIAATPVINYPEVAIIGPNRLVPRAMVIDGEITVRTMMNLSSSFDHRIIDGFTAASFIQEIKYLIEHPASLAEGTAP